MSFHASLWQVIVNGIFPKIDPARSAIETKKFLDTLKGSREEIANRLNKTLVSAGASETGRKIALVLLLTPDLKELHQELIGDWPNWTTFADLARIEWCMLTSDQHRDAFYLLSQVELPSYSPANDHLRRLAMELAEEIEPAKANLLQQKFDQTPDVTRTAATIWRSH